MLDDHFNTIRDRLKQDPGLPHPNPTTSYWQLPESPTVATLQSPVLPSNPDIVIIGSGITGCSIARHLLLTGPSTLKVCILEARTICSGATGRNGGNIKAVPEHTIPHLGKEGAEEIVHFTLANVEALLALHGEVGEGVREMGEVRRVETMNLFTTEDGFREFGRSVKVFDEEFGEYRGRGRLVGREELREKHGIHHAVGGYVASAGAAWPYRLITGIFAELLQQYPDRLGLEAKTPVTGIKHADNGDYTITTPRGTIQAKTIIHATNGHASHLLPGLRGPLYPVRGQMTAQTATPVAEKYAGKRSWSLMYDAGFDYIIQSPSGNEIMAGGGLAQAYDHGLDELGNTDDSVNSVLALAHLGGAMNAVFGIGCNTAMTAGVKSAWTGIMGFTADGLPLVGRLPREATRREGEGEWVSAGFNGYGMVNAWLCGKNIAERVLGKEGGHGLPKAYEISAERLGKMKAEDGLRHWVVGLGLE